MRAVATKPKVSARNKTALALGRHDDITFIECESCEGDGCRACDYEGQTPAEPVYESVYFQAIQEAWLARQEQNKKAFKGWNGNISPSSKITKTMCMTEYFNRVDTFLEFEPSTLMVVNMGTLLHAGYSEENVKSGVLYPFPEYEDNERQEWALKCRPEVGVWCKKTRIKGKIDAVLNVDGLPVIFDLKTKWADPKSWKEFCKNAYPDQSHKWQILLYLNRSNKLGLFDTIDCDGYRKRVRATYGVLGYVNMLMRPFSKGSYCEMRIEYGAKEREETNNVIRALADGGRQKREGRKRVKCSNVYCSTHGQEE